MSVWELYGEALLCHRSRYDEIKKDRAKFTQRQPRKKGHLRAFQN